MGIVVGIVMLVILAGLLFDLLFPLLLIGILVVGGMTATHMIVWDGNRPDVNIERGMEYMKGHMSPEPQVSGGIDK